MIFAAVRRSFDAWALSLVKKLLSGDAGIPRLLPFGGGTDIATHSQVVVAKNFFFATGMTQYPE